MALTLDIPADVAEDKARDNNNMEKRKLGPRLAPFIPLLTPILTPFVFFLAFHVSHKALFFFVVGYAALLLGLLICVVWNDRKKSETATGSVRLPADPER